MFNLPAHAAATQAAQPTGAAPAAVPARVAPVRVAPVRVAIVGLVHGHIAGFLQEIPRHSAVELVGICEPDTALAAQYEAKFHLPHALFYTDLDTMLRAQHPAAVLVYTSIAGHRHVIEEAAKYGASSMVEKPLATTMEDALAIRQAARTHHVNVLVNYETTWYASNRAAYDDLQQGKLGELRRLVVHDGHQGPAEIGVGPEFLKWLTDPVQNGAGALFDFGCYGADLSTWLMRGQTPLSVTAVTQTDKPKLYPHVDDEATVIVRYPRAQAVLMASWNWPFARKDMEVYGATGYAITVANSGLRLRTEGQAEETKLEATPLARPEDDSLDYLVGVLRGQIDPRGDLTALDTNMVVMQILTAARESARMGRTVELQPLPR
jgi:predicted dehydrogenase